MLDAQKTQEKVNGFRYWDLKILEISTLYFGDEVLVRMREDKTLDLVFNFIGCDRVETQHWFGYPKFGPTKEQEIRDLSYYAQDISVHIEEHAGEQYYVFDLDLHPMYMKVYCRDLEVGIFDAKEN